MGWRISVSHHHWVVGVTTITCNTQPHHPLWALLPALPPHISGCTHSWSLHLSQGVPPALGAACLVQSPRALRCETVQERSQNYTQGSANAAATRRGHTGNRHGLRRVCVVGQPPSLRAQQLTSAAGLRWGSHKRVRQAGGIVCAGGMQWVHMQLCQTVTNLSVHGYQCCCGAERGWESCHLLMGGGGLELFELCLLLRRDTFTSVIVHKDTCTV